MKKIKITKIIAVLSALCCLITAGAVSVNAEAVDDVIVPDSSDIVTAETDSILPASYSSKDLGYVTEIKNQLYSVCWACAGLEVFESKLLRDGISIGDMSVNHLNAWATTNSNGTGWQRNYTDSGFTKICTGYLTSWYGGAEESLTGNIELSNNITGDMITSDFTRYGTTSIKYLDDSDMDEIKRSIVNNGGVFASFRYAPGCLHNSSTAYYMPSTYIGIYEGHSIEIVGWDDNYSRKRFGTAGDVKPENNGAWLARNSWGDNNSLGGYFWISYEDAYIFSREYFPSFTIESYQEITDNVRLEQNEIYGATYEFSYVDRDEITYINKFDFSNGYNTLDKVVFETTCKGADYSVFYIPVKDDKPDDDESTWTQIGSGKVDFNGYICADIEDFELPLGYGAIGIRIDTTELNNGIPAESPDYAINSLGVGEWIVNIANGACIFINDSEYGDSFIFYDDNMSDLLDWYLVNNDDEIGGTFVIKAVTTGEGPQVTMLGDVDLNGKLSVLDATDVQKYIAGIKSFTEVKKLNADFNGDGKISVLDATEIQKRIAGLI